MGHVSRPAPVISGMSSPISAGGRQTTGHRRSWCEKAVREARDQVLDPPPARADARTAVTPRATPLSDASDRTGTAARTNSRTGSAPGPSTDDEAWVAILPVSAHGEPGARYTCLPIFLIRAVPIVAADAVLAGRVRTAAAAGTLVLILVLCIGWIPDFRYINGRDARWVPIASSWTKICHS